MGCCSSSALLEAAKSGVSGEQTVADLRRLISQGADVTATDEYGQTALHIFLGRISECGNEIIPCVVEGTRLLLESGVDALGVSTPPGKWC